MQRHMLFFILISTVCPALSLDLDVYSDGLFGVLLNSVVDLFCDFNEDSSEDMSENLTIHWYDTNTDVLAQSILKDAATAFLEDGFDTAIPWIFLFTGYGTSPTTDTTVAIRDALLNLTDNYVLILDHTNYTSHDTWNTLEVYENSVSSVFPIGLNVKTLFFDPMINAGVLPENIQMVGHSLGAQMVSRIGSLLMSDGNEIAKCTGLDPAGPCYSSSANDYKLKSGDCKFVEVIHTNAGQKGMDDTISDYEAFANCAGKVQPYCTSFWSSSCYPPTNVLQSSAYTLGISNSCSHGYAAYIYADSVTEGYMATPCEDYTAYANGGCSGNVTRSVGFNSDASLVYSGSYFFNTEDCLCTLN